MLLCLRGECDVFNDDPTSALALTEAGYAIAARYPASAGIGWHTDALQFGNCIIGISLNGSARLQFRQNGTTIIAHELLAEEGSLYIMHGPVRWEYQHQIVPVKNERYSLTFRSVRSDLS